MTVSLQRIDQIHNPDAYDDTLSGANVAASEGAAVDFADHSDALVSQLKRILAGNAAGNWYDDPATIGPSSSDASLTALSLRAKLEDKNVLTYRLNLVDLAVPASQNWVVFTAAGNLPGANIAIANSQQGAVSAQLAGAVGAHALTELGGLNALKPKNLVQVFNAATGDVLQSAGRDVYALLQVGTAATDGNAFATTGNDQGQLSFVRANSTYDDLEAVPVADIESTSIVYGYSRRDDLQDTPEEAFRGDLEVAQGVAGAVSLDSAYDGGHFIVLDGTDVDIRIADTKSWVFRSGTGNGLLVVTRNDTTGDLVQVGSDVGEFDSDAVANDFANSVKVDTGTQAINIGDTASGVIDSTSIETRATTGNNEVSAPSGDVQFQTVRETTALPLDDATAGKISALSGGPHASISAAIAHAIDSGGVDLTLKVFTAGSNYAQGANIPAATLDLTSFTIDMNTPANTDAFVFLNGRLLHGGNATTKNDAYVGDTPASGDMKVDFPKGIKSGDVIITIGLQG